jgi:hypothetical protein
MDDLRHVDDESFYRRVLPRLDALEAIRRAKYAAFRLRVRIGTALAFVLFPVTGFIDFWLLRLQSGHDDSAAGLSVVAAGALYWWVTQPRRQYAKAYKTDILPDIAKLFGDLFYDPDGKIPMAEMTPFKIIPSHDRYNAEDYFTGTYHDARIAFSEIHLQERRRSGKSTRYVTVFKGLAIMMTLPQEKFAGHTILQGNSIALAQWLKEKTSGLQRADLVDPEFEKEFDVFTDDQMEARYLIHPVMIEKIKGLKESYDASGVMAAYRKDTLLILLSSARNHFEPADIKIPATDRAGLLAMKREVEHILSLVDEMEMYDRAKIRQSA